MAAEVKLIAPAGYLPGAPYLARVEVRTASGARDWDLWNAEAVLSVDRPGVSLATNRIVLRNGLGTALLTINGSVDFVLTATVNGESVSRTVTHLGTQPVTTVSGVLPGTSTIWSGVVRVTGNVTVPAGHTLTIQSNTLVLINGVASGTTGIRLNVNGAIRSLGTEAHPVTVTCADPSLNWGQIRHDNAAPSTYQHTFISKAGRAPGEGHTGTGPAVRPSNSTVTFESCVISDLTAGGGTIGKIMSASGSDLTMRDCVLARARMGPEITGTGLVCTDSYLMDMTGPDDSDGIYLHGSGGRPLVLSGCVLAGGDDDAVDTLDSNVTIENCIIRDWRNPSEDAKGVSVFHGEVELRRCLIVDCFAGVAAKSSGPLAVVRIDRCTIRGTDRGLSAATKSNATAGNVSFYVANSIVRAADAIHSDFGPEKFVSVAYCNLSEAWPGAGNFTADPLFVSESAGDFRLQPGSPCIDAGDPASPSDPDGSRADLGFYTAESPGFWVTITEPVSGGVFAAPTNLTVTAAAQTATGSVLRVEFFEGGTRLGADGAAPFSLIWNAVPVGTYMLRAVATRSDGLSTTSAPVTIFVTTGDGPATNVLVAAGSEWKYLDDGSDQGIAWRQAGFDDSAWRSGLAQLGYGDGDERTVISFGPSANNKFATYYFRKTFVVDDPARVQSLRLNLLRDDGAIVYLNGNEAYRISMPPGPANYRTFATQASDYNWRADPLERSHLVAGTNLIAVEVHQGNATSSDVSFDLELAAVISAPENARPIVAITQPADGTTYPAPASFTISASAADPDGTVANVAFHANGGKLGDDAAAPYDFVWSDVPAGVYALTAVATDATGLSGTSSVVNVTVSAQVGPPAVAGQSPPPGPVTNLTELTVVFSKPVVGVDASDLLVGGIPATAVAGSEASYRFTFSPPGTGPQGVSWSAVHGITDTFSPPNAFNATAPGSTWQYEFIDTLPPYMQTVIPAPGSIVAALTNLMVTFNEPVSGVRAADLSINSIPASGLSGAAAGPYTFTFAQPAPGAVAVAWSGSQGVRDLGNNRFNGGVWSYALDTNQVGVVINEIMYHPLSENPLEEYLELHNRGSAPVNLEGWRLRDAVAFTFPAVTIPGGGYLVVAADLAVFRGKYPGVSNVVGNWTGVLSNSREDIDLDDAGGTRVDSVRYADEGDWAIRRRGLPDRGFRGWIWFAEHDGLGKSLELINPSMSNNNGQNWASSLEPEGTPGRANSVLASRIAPLIENVIHFPMVPRATDPVRVTAQIRGGNDPVATLHFRVDSATPPPFSALAMRDDGLEGDASARDGIYTATVPAQSNNAVVEFYIEASDSTGLTRTWPAPALVAEDGGGPSGQMVNALYQVDDTLYSGPQPLYKLVLTETERAELQAIHDNVGGAANSDAQVNATFVGIEPSSAELRYLIGVRNRGHGTRARRPNNFRFNFRSDEPWKGALALNINAQFTWLQSLGAALNLKSGVVGAYSRPVQVRVNNANLVFTGGIDRTYGSYAANEVINADWADRHFPDDGEGNVYRALRDRVPSDFDYRTEAFYPGLFGPENKDSYTNTWFKTTNVSEDDWSDLIGMLRVFGPNGTEPFTPENLRRVINVEQWLRHLAVMNLLGNSETGLNSGYNDDYFMYRGVLDPRFILMYYDLDQILGFNGAFGAGASLFSATDTGGVRGAGRAFGRFLRHPEFELIYYATLKDLIETSFSAPQFNALVDQVLGDFVPEPVRLQIKSWMEARRAFVQSQLPAVLPGKPPVAVVTGVPRSPTPVTVATLTVGGAGITHYRFSLDGGGFGPETAVTTPISLSSLGNGTHIAAVIGRDAAGIYQAESNATFISWTVNTAWPAVRLNEVIASRSANQRDQLELYNEGQVAIDLSGMRLTDDPANPNRFTFGATVLAPGAYLTLDADQLGFAFSNSGDGVFLFDSAAKGGAWLDSVRFGLQITDLSIGRVAGGGEWHLTQPTFGAANSVQPLGDPGEVRINEWLAFGVSPFPEDFIELYNPGLLPVAIGGGYISDRPVGAPRRSPIFPLTFIPAQGFAVFVSGNGQQADEFNFNLASEQGEIALFGPDLEWIDSVFYGPQLVGRSMGRCPDGSVIETVLESPTPRGPNHCPSVPLPPQTINVLPFDQVWKYDVSGTDLGTTWKDPGYDDSAWPAGPGVLGFEDAALPAPIRTAFPETRGNVAYYFRTVFTIDPGFTASSLQITLLIDDGAAFYLNGQEIGSRFNLPPGAGFQTLASGTVGNAAFQVLTIPPDSIRPGANLFAAEVHQSARTSSDLVFGLKFDALIVTNSAAQAGVMINEVLASNATLDDVDGSRPDWVEIYNPSTSTVDLAGMSLSDSVAAPRRWVFPPGSLVAAKGFLKIRCDAGKPASNTNSGFGLQSAGGAIYLFNRPADGGSLQSSVAYGLQAPDWSLGRVPDGTTNWVLNIPTLGMANLEASLGNPQALRINEWLANPLMGEDWFEIFNPGAEPVEISRLWLSDNLTDRLKHPLPPYSFIGNGAQAFLLFTADENLAAGADHVNFKLSAAGEALALSTAAGVLIDGVSFGPQTAGVSQGRLPDGTGAIVNFTASPTPGRGNFLPLDTVVVNELLSHSDPPLEDAVELFNPGGAPVDISGWYLSDSPVNLRKYQFPPDTLIPPGGYLVLTEQQFNSDNAFDPFSFSSARGDEVYLSQTVNGTLTGYRAFASFGPSENGVSFGRFPTSRGFHFVPVTSRTFGGANAAARVGPVVISEIHYHPSGTNEALEFVELYNLTTAAVALYDPANPSNTWRLRKGVEFEFPPGSSVPAGGYLVLVSFDPLSDTASRAGFQQAYGSGAALAGPYRGQLRNSRDTVELQRPDAPQTVPGPDFGLVPYLMVDRIDYEDVAPWPASADGAGHSLQKINLAAYGNDPVNWIAAPPNPGPATSNDSDGDGLPNDWELLHGFNPNDPTDALADSDGDGSSNLEEFRAGTHPLNAASVFKTVVRMTPAREVMLEFVAAANRSYTVEFRASLAAGSWQVLAQFGPAPSERLMQLPITPTGAARFFRIVSP